MSRVDENAGMLWRHNGFDDSGEIVDIGKSLDTEQDVVEWSLLIVGGILGCTDNCKLERSIVIPLKVLLR